MGPDSRAQIALDEDMSLVLMRSGNHIEASVQVRNSPSVAPLFDLVVATLPHQTLEARLSDVNFDGIRDLLVETQVGYGGVNVFFDLYLGTPTGFEPDTAEQGLSNPEIDQGRKQISTMMRSGPTWYRDIYLISNWRPYRFMTTTAAGRGISYARFLSDDGQLQQEMITDAVQEDPRDWQPVQLILPGGAPYPLRGEPDDASATTGALPDGSTILLRRFSEDRRFALVEHANNRMTGWLKTDWLPMPDGVRF
uniref:XAC2610-related protein n=1 Tax=Pararhizobium sp. IMCC3301 TaxID=3067904 RepID=UPI002741D1A6|nr:hypothetical protein [Pararhizobium sp. IMCC3301]